MAVEVRVLASEASKIREGVVKAGFCSSYTLESTVGVGTVFTVDIPFTLMTDEKIKKSSVVTVSEPTISRSKKLGVMNILLVEDNKINQMICEQFLSRLDCTVEIAETGVAALEKYGEQETDKSYDAIFMDCNMPEMDGFAAARGIRQIEQEKNMPATPIIAITAHVQEEVKQQCLKAGMNAFLSKPFLFGALEAMIDKVRMGDVS